MFSAAALEPDFGRPHARESLRSVGPIDEHVGHAIERGDTMSLSVPFGIVKAPQRVRELEADIATLRARLRELLDD